MKYGIDELYCIDIVPAICDLYGAASLKLTGKSPKFIDWNCAQKMSGKDGLNTLISVGCLPHLPIKTQTEYLGDINNKFANFFVEIKYKNNSCIQNSDNAFSINELQNLKQCANNVKYKNFGYMSKFIHAQPARRDFFVSQSRSLFLCR